VLFWKYCNPKHLDNAVIGVRKYLEPIGIDILAWMNTDKTSEKGAGRGVFLASLLDDLITAKSQI
jgi:hypothetical protein